MTKNSNKKGFTLLEILVIITIIGILATVALVFYGDTRQRSRITQAKHDLDQVRSAISIMSLDTDEWPGHQSIGKICSGTCDANELFLNTNNGGLINNNGSFSNWSGPYIKSNLKDPWGNYYFFDSDYDLIIGGGDQGHYGVVIGTLGPDAETTVACRVINDYQVDRPGSAPGYCDEDDILLILENPN